MERILWSLRYILFIGFAIIFLLFLSIEGSARIITVDDDGEADFAKIQDAIDNSSSGDKIRVFDGMYRENVIIKKSVILEGNASASTIIDGEMKGDCVEVQTNNATISNCTMMNGSTGILLHYSSHCIVNENHVMENRFGIRLLNSSENVITNNICYYNEEAGISLYGSVRNSIQNNDCSFNPDYGISLGADSDNNSLERNTCRSAKLGISLIGYHNMVLYNTIYQNEKGIFISQYASSNSLHYNNIFNNSEYGVSIAFYRNDPVDASHNWWGDETGPYHPGENPNGNGNTVSNHIVFSPWLKEPYSEFDREDDHEDVDWVNILLWIILIFLIGILLVVMYFTFMKVDFIPFVIG